MKMEEIAHRLENTERTNDVRLTDKVSFSKMDLKDPVRKGLLEAGYKYPTVIQANAIPIGKAGIDMFVQSKSGTGKTLIFSTIVLESYKSELSAPQSLILAPTREIAVQIADILSQIGKFLTGFKVASIIGGLDVGEDRKKLQGCKAIVGTPGRVLHLIRNSVLNTEFIHFLVLDEVDKLMADSFQEDIFNICSNISSNKRQTIACSATLNENMDKILKSLAKNPLLVTTENRTAHLIGIKQFVYEIEEEKTSILEMNTKLEAVKAIFTKLPFKQCLVFSGSQSRAESYRNFLEKEGWPCEVISGGQEQKIRLEKFKKFREYKIKILISTDLMSRGIDSEHVNLVINLELPNDGATYLHRIGRAGRFGSSGISITFIASKKDSENFAKMISEIGPDMEVYRISDMKNLDLWNENCALEMFRSKKVTVDEEMNKENHSTNVNSNESKISDKKLNSRNEEMHEAKPNRNISMGLFVEAISNSAVTLDDASSITVDSEQNNQVKTLNNKSALPPKPALKPKPIILTKLSADCRKKLEDFANLQDESVKDDSNIFDDYFKTTTCQHNESIDKKLTSRNSKNFTSTKTINLEPPESSYSDKILEFKCLVIDSEKSEKERSDVFQEYKKTKSNVNEENEKINCLSTTTELLSEQNKLETSTSIPETVSLTQSQSSTSILPATSTSVGNTDSPKLGISTIPTTTSDTEKAHFNTDNEQPSTSKNNNQKRKRCNSSSVGFSTDDGNESSNDNKEQKEQQNANVVELENGHNSEDSDSGSNQSTASSGFGENCPTDKSSGIVTSTESSSGSIGESYYLSSIQTSSGEEEYSGSYAESSESSFSEDNIFVDVNDDSESDESENSSSEADEKEESREVGVCRNENSRDAKRTASPSKCTENSSKKTSRKISHRKERGASAATSNDFNSQYSQAYFQWTTLYWKLVNPIQDYAKFSSYAKSSKK